MTMLDGCAVVGSALGLLLVGCGHQETSKEVKPPCPEIRYSTAPGNGVRPLTAKEWARMKECEQEHPRR